MDYAGFLLLFRKAKMHTQIYMSLRVDRMGRKKSEPQNVFLTRLGFATGFIISFSNV